MYYVVYLVEFSANIVIPYTWVRDGSTMLQKFVRCGMNCSQIHWCFFSDHADAMVIQNGKNIPNIHYAADFGLEPAGELPCEGGIYKCKVIDLFGENAIKNSRATQFIRDNRLLLR